MVFNLVSLKNLLKTHKKVSFINFPISQIWFLDLVFIDIIFIFKKYVSY